MAKLIEVFEWQRKYNTDYPDNGIVFLKNERETLEEPEKEWAPWRFANVRRLILADCGFKALVRDCENPIYAADFKNVT